MPAALRQSVLALTFSALFSGCLSDDQWTFGISRSFYLDGGIDSFTESLGEGGGMVAGGAIALVALPVAVDIVLLPVTLPVDLWGLAATHGSASREESPQPMDWSGFSQRSPAQLPDL